VLDVNMTAIPVT